MAAVNEPGSYIRELGKRSIANPGFTKLDKSEVFYMTRSKRVGIDFSKLPLDALNTLKVTITGQRVIKKEEEKADAKESAEKPKPEEAPKVESHRYECDLKPLIKDAVQSRWRKALQSVDLDTLIKEALSNTASKMAKTLKNRFQELFVQYQQEHAFLQTRHYVIPEYVDLLPPLLFTNFFENDSLMKRDIKLLVLPSDRATSPILAHKFVLLSASKYYQSDYFESEFNFPKRDAKPVKKGEQETDKAITISGGKAIATTATPAKQGKLSEKSKPAEPLEKKDDEGLLEDEDSRVDDNTLVFRGTTAFAVEQVVRFFYLGREGVKFENNQQAKDLFQLADRLVIRSLKTLCTPLAFAYDLETSDPSKLTFPELERTPLIDALNSAFVQSNTAKALKEALNPSNERIQDVINRYKLLMESHFETMPDSIDQVPEPKEVAAESDAADGEGDAEGDETDGAEE